LFANKYHISPKEVDEMPIRLINGFLDLENHREQKRKLEDLKNKHKSSNAKRKW
jgi:elongation factor P--beta-lysine ligase